MSHSRVVDPVRYIVITPARNEAEHIEKTIRSVIAQTVRPVRWIVVNDGSTDTTPEIIGRWAARYSWITPVHVPSSAARVNERKTGTSPESQLSRGMRARQAKEIDAFYEGYEHVHARDWDFLIKLDGDVSFEPDYFEKCFREFDADPSLGIGGGVVCHVIDHELKVETTPEFHVRGATKIYKRACWNAIGGVVRGAGWDTLDEVKANMVGWRTRSFNHLSIIHHRFTGAANGAWQNEVKNGLWNHICGYHPLFMLAKCGKRLFQRPFGVSAAGLFFGYVLGSVRGIPRVEDKRVIRYLRQQQMRRLLFRHTIWK